MQSQISKSNIICSWITGKIIKTQEITLEGIPEKWDLRARTWDPGLLDGTQDPGFHKWDPGPQYDQVGTGSRDPLSGTQDLGPLNFQVRPRTWDP